MLRSEHDLTTTLFKPSGMSRDTDEQLVSQLKTKMIYIFGPSFPFLFSIIPSQVL